MRGKLWILTALFCVVGIGRAATAGWSLAYYPEWNQGSFPPASINWKAITHISHFAILPNGGGINTNGFSDAECNAVVTTAHAHGVKALICVGGAGVGNGFLNSTQNAATRAKFISALIAFMKKYGYDGIDTDWEENFGSDLTLYVTWHKELRDSLDLITPRPLLTAAVEDWYANPTGMISQYIDFMDDMCYGDNASSAGNDLKNLTAVGVPKSQLGVGMGLAPGGGMGEQDTNSINAEGAWAIQNGYGGIMEWDLGDGNPGQGNTPAQLWSALVKFVPAAPSALLSANSMLAGNSGLFIGADRLTGAPEIHYSVASQTGGALVDLSLFNLNGSLSYRLVHGFASPGAYSIPLDQVANRGVPLQAGTYVVKYSAGSNTESTTARIIR